ncbi:hypothetical protein BDN70DRAFT_889523 [Pholiota conissans]|uniref:Uncharacterized protein n=1 Tax=Pholiota conissans TaxID=109636 RepID=A0A9P5ZDB1_9AGAR|nr:hypothetical protein BDN70DRAFT_889523 [Pholiota conissans]
MSAYDWGNLCSRKPYAQISYKYIDLFDHILTLFGFKIWCRARSGVFILDEGPDVILAVSTWVRTLAIAQGPNNHSNYSNTNGIRYTEIKISGSYDLPNFHNYVDIVEDLHNTRTSTAIQWYFLTTLYEQRSLLLNTDYINVIEAGFTAGGGGGFGRNQNAGHLNWMFFGDESDGERWSE